MSKWLSGAALEGIAPGLDFVVYSLGILVVVVLALWLFRRVAGGTFIAGGIHRHRRLAILDAAAVDTKRRLVLVRRDDHEHLLLIGGATDIVVERNIDQTNTEEPKDSGKPAKAGKREPQTAFREPAAHPGQTGASLAKTVQPVGSAAPANAPAARKLVAPGPDITAASPAPTRSAAASPSVSRVDRPAEGNVTSHPPARSPQTQRPVDDLSGAKPAVNEPSLHAEERPSAQKGDSSVAKDKPSRPQALEDEMERLLQELSSGR